MKRFFSPVIRGSSSSLNATSTNVAEPFVNVLSQSQSGPNVDVLLPQSAKPNEYDLANALKAAPLSSTHGTQVHAIVIKYGFVPFTILMTALLNFKLKCGNLQEAIKVFEEMPDRDVVSWTSVIVGYAQQHCYKDSLNSFQLMVASGVISNGHSFSGALSACSGLQARRQGQQIHCHVFTSGVLGGNAIVQNSLLRMYWRCQCVFDAQNLFDSIPNKENIAWNEMISGYLQCGQTEEALKLFASMVSQGLKPDNFTYAICADACAGFASIQQGEQIHACILKTGFQSDLIVTNALVDMYAKCGCVNSAELVFCARPSKDRLLWTTMISGFGRNGKVKEVLAMFERMLSLNVKPDEITYLVVLSACGHAGLVEQGYSYFRLMTKDSSVSISQEHYACMVDLLCRSGYLVMALDFIKEMPITPGISVWTTFLGCCKMHQNIELARFAAEQLVVLGAKNLGNFVSLSNVYALEYNWSETEGIRDRMKNNNVKKEPGCSWIELKTGLHVFLTTGRSHSKINEISFTLKGLMNICWEECHVE